MTVDHNLTWGFEYKDKIDKASPIPLYLQLRAILEHKINDQQFQSHESVPSEMELCDLYSVSRTTVRQTLREMLNDGIIYRKSPRGRLLVASPRIQQKAARLQGFFTEDILSAGMEALTKVLSIKEVTKPSLGAQFAADESDLFWETSRIHLGNNEPLVLQTSYIPKKLLPNLDQIDLTKSIFQHIESLYGYKLTSAKQQISCRLPTNHEKVQLQLPPKVCVFQVHRMTYDEQGVAVEYFECILRGDRYIFSMELSG
jgi:GntR family transcriptional regulator